MKAGDLVEPSDLFNDGYYYGEEIHKMSRWVGVVTRIINEHMTPELVEVSWSHGETMRHYADDLKIMLDYEKKD